MFSSLPVSLASLQPTPCLPSLVTLPPASTDSFQPQTISGLQSFSSNSAANRRLTQDSPSPLSLVSCNYIQHLKHYIDYLLSKV